MYESHINDLTALFKGKREKAKNYLIEAIKRDPYNLTNELLNAPEKAWPYVSEIIRSNPKGVFLAILRGGMSNPKAGAFLNEIGYGRFIPLIKEFHSEISKAERYRKEGIPINYSAIKREFLSGNVQKALEDIKRLNTTGRKLKVMLNRWKELKFLADKAGEDIPDITEAIRNLDVDKAQEILDSIDEPHLRERAEFMEKYREADGILKGIEWVQGGKELRERLDKAKDVNDLAPVLNEIKELNQKVRKILSLHDDEEIRNFMKESLEEAEEKARLKKKMFGIAEELGENYVYMLKEDFKGNLPEVLGEYISVKYPVLSEDAEKIFEEALSVARGIEDDYWRAWALSNIASELAKVDVDRAKKIFEEALSVARGIEKDSYRASALRNIASELAKVDVERALSVARSIEDKNKRASVLKYIASELAKVDVDRALSVAREIEEDWRRALALSNIASGLAKVDVDRAKRVFDEALSVARKIRKNDDRAFALQYIAGELAKVDVDRALSVARGIEKDSYRASALSEIASELAKVDVDRALSIARGIEDEDDRAEALSAIASEIAKAYTKKILQEMPSSLIRRVVEEEWGVEQIKSTIKNYMEHRKDVSKIYSRYGELMEYLKPFGITEELPEMDYAHIDTWIKESKRIINEMEQKKKEIEGLKDRISELRDKAHMIGIKIPENITSIDEMKKIISEAEKRMESMKPSLSLNISGDITENLWSKAEIVIKNDGNINLENITIEFQTDVMDIRGITRINSIKKGEERKIPIRIKSKDAGYVPVELLFKYRDPLTEKDEETRVFPEIFVAKEGTAGTKERKKGKVKRHINIPDEEEKIDITGVGDYFSYKIGKKIGQGGFSKVYLVRDEEDNEFAVKIPLDVNLNENETLELPEKILKGFIKEARIWNTLTERNIPGIVQLYGFGVRPFPWFVMDLCDESLAKRMKEMEFHEKIEVLVKVLNTLNEIHYLGIVHRDIKPQNILFKDSEPLLTDFGLGKALNKASKSSQGYSGTLEYSSPEQFNRKLGGSDRRTDIWQVGVLAYEMLTGKLPFEGDDITEIMFAVLNEEPEHPSDVNPEIPRELGDAVMKALAKRKEDRWQSAGEFKNTLKMVRI